MSGRLIILGKKGYCPWNSKNLSRIRRDEKEHREAQEREQRRQADEASILRLAALKKAGNSKDGHQERFSLFESEENASLDRSTELQVSKSKGGEKNHDGFSCRSGRFGSHSFTKQGRTDKFYLKAGPNKEPLGKKELQRHREMDPMREFHNAQEEAQRLPSQKTVRSENCDSDVHIRRREKRKRSSKLHICSDDTSSRRRDVHAEGTKEKHRKKKKRRHREEHQSRKQTKSTKSKKGKSDGNSRNNTDSIEELRKKRAEREQQERQRQNAVLITAKKALMRRNLKRA